MKKKVFKKIFAIVMMLCVVMSYSGFAFADTGDAGTPAKKTSQEQVGNYYKADDKTASITDALKSTDKTEKTYEDGLVTVNKTIKGTDTENVFDITLDITTKNKIIASESLSEDAAAVIVLDASYSMYGDRWKQTKDAAKKFVRAFMSEKTGVTRKVAIVVFANNAVIKTIPGSTDGWIVPTAQNINTIESFIGSLKIGNSDGLGLYTNMEDGLTKAETTLKSSQVSDIKNQNIVMISDGNPTKAINHDGTGQNTSCHISHDRVEKLMGTIGKDLPNVTTHAVFIGNDKVTCTRDSHGCTSCGLNKAVDKWLDEDCNFDEVISVADASNLTAIFEYISTAITLRPQAWLVTDPMGSNIKFKSFVKTPDLTKSNALSCSDGTLNWDLKATVPTYDKTLAEDKRTYTYSCTYRVELQNTKSGFVVGQDYKANGVTSLTYLIEDSSATTLPELKTAYFNIPSVQGLEGGFDFVKKNEKGNAISGVTFTLTTSDDSAFSKTATSDKDGKVSFKNIPSGHKYVLTETAPANYVAANYDVSVDYGTVTGTAKTAAKTALGDVVVNYPDTKDVTVTKVWSDADDQDGKRPESITVQLYADYNLETGAKEAYKYGDEVTLTAANEKKLADNKTDSNTWVYTYPTKLPKAVDGHEVTYTVKEVSSDTNYTATESGLTVTNVHTPETKNITVTKTWKNDSYEEEVTEEPAEPEETPEEETPAETKTVTKYHRNDLKNGITIVLKATVNGKKVADDREVTLTESNATDTADEWSYTFTGLPKYNNGSEITYTVTEKSVPGYVVDIDGFDITNTYSPNKMTLSLTKNWNDDGNRDNLRTDSVHAVITGTATVDGETVTKTYECDITKANDWNATIDVDARAVENDASTEYKYTVEETNVPEGYKAEVKGGASEGFVITNTHEAAKKEISVKKIWDDNDNAASKRPESINIVISGGEETYTVVLGSGDEWSKTFEVPANKDGEEITYTVSEGEVASYKQLGDVEYVEGVYVITNKYVAPYIPPITPSGDDDPEEPPVDPDDPSDNPDDPPVDPNGGSDVIGDDDPINGDPMGDPDVIGSDDPEDIGADPMGVKTGDEAGMIPWALCFGTAIMMLGGAVALRRKEEE